MRQRGGRGHEELGDEVVVREQRVDPPEHQAAVARRERSMCVCVCVRVCVCV